MSDRTLRDLLLMLSIARDHLRRALILDQPDRDEIAQYCCDTATLTATAGPT